MKIPTNSIRRIGLCRPEQAQLKAQRVGANAFSVRGCHLAPRVKFCTQFVSRARDEQSHYGEVQDYADLARLGHVSRARLSQIMDLLLLAPDIQEEILFLPAVEAGDDPISERQLRAIVAVAEWGRQRRAWRGASEIGFRRWFDASVDVTDVRQIGQKRRIFAAGKQWFFEIPKIRAD